MKEQVNSSIDLSYLETTFSGNKKIINKILQSFIDSTPQQLTQLSESAINSDWENVKMLAHKTKSSFNTIGAKSGGELLLKIELDSATDSTSHITSLIDEILNINTVIIEEIKIQLNN